MALPATAAPVTVAVDFEGGTYAPWVKNGSPTTVEVVADPSDAENSVLSIGGRPAGHDGVSLDLLAHFAPGAAITITSQLAVAEGGAATAVNFAVERVIDGEQGWDWTSDPVSITDAAFTEVAGTYTIPADATAAKLYVQTPNGPHSDLLIDEIVVAGEEAPPAGPVVVFSQDFEEDYAPFFANPGAVAVELVADDASDGEQAARVSGRGDGWHGLYLNLLDDVELEPGTYQISAMVKLAEGGPASTGLHLTVNQEPYADGDDQYKTVGQYQKPVGTGEWVEIGGEYVLTEDRSKAHLYFDVQAQTVGEATVHPSFLVDDFVILGEGDEEPPPFEAYEGTWDFDDATAQGWVPRNSQGSPTVAATDTEFHDGTHSLLVSNRTGQGDGAGYDFAEIFQAGVEYEISAWVKMAEGQPTDSVVLSIQTGESTFANLTTVANVTDETWVLLETAYTFTGGDLAFVYFESPWAGGDNGTNYSFLVDTISVTAVAPSEIEDLPGIYTEFEGQFPVGVAIDARETVGAPSELTLRHFNQVTAENHMKVEAWYEGGQWEAFGLHPQAAAIMDFAQANDLGVYGHVLVWHSQTPDWFFQDDEGVLLTDSDEDYEVMRERLETHIENVAAALADEYGPFGSETNPLIAWDVVNEVVNDQASPGTLGLRNSFWYQIMGEDYIDLAFEYADKYFNDVYAVDDEVVERPVMLFINDYNTEQSGKQNRYYDLVQRLLDRDVPIDGVGHQFHVSLSMPVEALDGTLERFSDTGLLQAVTEMDVTVGNNPTNALMVEQGYYYRDAFRAFREYAEDLFSVTIWGLSDNRSWRSAQAPLVFNSRLEAKPAYHGIMDGDMPARVRTADVFRGDLAIGSAAVDDVTWDQLPLHAVGAAADFQLRWMPDHLTAYVSVEDASVDAEDAVTFSYGDDAEVTVTRAGGSSATKAVRSTASGWEAVVSLPLATPVAQNGTLQFDVEVTDGATTTAWAEGDAKGTLTLVEALSFVEVGEAPTAPTIDGEVDDVWGLSSTVTTMKNTQGTGGAWAAVKTLWSGDGQTLYVLMDVTDGQLDAGASNPWEQDSVEIYIDRGNFKNGSYRYDDNQIRIDFEGDVSFGTGDEAFQEANIEYAVAETAKGYVVEVAINLLESYGGEGTFHGVDFQVNDATDGVRTSIRNWADPTGLGYQSTARWGVAQLVDEVSQPFPDVAGNPFLDEIVWMWQSGLATGYSDGTFRPVASVSRQAMAAFVYRVVTGEDDAPECSAAPFPDVTVGNEFCGEIDWLVENGLANGYDDGTFRPTAPISRQAMAAFLSRIENGPQAEACSAAPFPDVPVGHPFCDEIAWLKDSGITTGYADGGFHPTAPISRQAMAAFLYRGVVENGMFDELWTPPAEFVPGGAVNPVVAPVLAARGEGDVMALTFDDGPNPGETEDLLDFLGENDIQAVFCVIGQNIQAPGGAAVLNRIVDEGHVLCNHTTSYADMGTWSQAQIQADLLENLEIIRDALGDPEAPVPYFRAPNGTWGQTPQVAVDLGMQPLAVANTISDWETQDVATLEANLRAAITPGQIVLAHDGGGDRAGTVAAVMSVVEEYLGDGWTTALPVGGPAMIEPVPVGPTMV